MLGAMRILITGATGKFGPLLAAALRDAGHQVAALVHAQPLALTGVE